MSVKSVIEIDVLDEKFQTFAKEFEKIKKALAQMPSDWNKANTSGEKGIKSVGKSLQDAKKKQDDFNKSIKDGEQALKNIANVTSNIARNMANTAISFAKFLTLGAVGGGFGLGALASATSGQRRTAQGLGITTGQLRSAEVYGGRYINPIQTLGNLADIQSDITKQYLLNPLALGNTTGKSAGELLPDTLTSIRKLYKQFGGQRQVLESLGTTQIVDYESQRRLAGLSDKEFKEFIENLKKGNKAFETQDKVDKAFQDFWVKLKESSQKLQISLIEGLEKLPESLGKLSDSIADAIKIFLSNPNLKQWFEDLGEGIKNFATYISSAEFKQDINSFIYGVKNLADSVVEALRFLGILKRPAISQEEIDQEKKKLPWWVIGKESIAKSNIEEERNTQQKAYNFFKSKGYSENATIGILANLKAESDYKTGTIGDQGKAYGLAQWHPDRQKLFEKQFGHSIYKSSLEEQLEFIDYELKNNERSSGRALSGATDIRGAVQAGIGYERPADPVKALETRLAYANKIRVQVNNNAGADINTSANAIQNPRGAN